MTSCNFLLTKQYELTEIFFDIFRYFGFEFSPIAGVPEIAPPSDPLSVNLQLFYEFAGISFCNPVTPTVTLLGITDGPLDVDRWSALVFSAAAVIEKELGGDNIVKNESYNALEHSLRAFVYQCGDIGKQAIPAALPSGWRYEEQRKRLEPCIDGCMQMIAKWKYYRRDPAR